MKDYSEQLKIVAEKHQHIFKEVNGKYPGNTHENCACLLWDLCGEVKKTNPSDKLGLLTKNPGENGYTWPNGIRTSHDAIAIPNGERTDIIGSAGDINYKPTLEWQPKPPNEWRAHNVWIAHTEVKKDVVTPPNPPVEKPKKDYERDFGGDARGVQFMTLLFADYRVNNVPPNEGMGTWPWRVMFDAIHNGLTLEQAIEKQRENWVKLLGGKRYEPESNN